MERESTLERRARLLRWLVLAAGLVVAGLVWSAPAADAQNLGDRTLSRGSSGNDVIELQIRTAGWYDNCAGVSCYNHFHLDGLFGPKTERAVRNFQKAYGVTPDGVVRPGSATISRLAALRDGDGSTRHFDWSEFHEKSASCNTNNRGTFNGGWVDSHRVLMNVRQLMYRLEVIRHKMSGQHPVYVSSGYRSVAYQDCLRQRTSNAARVSQHSYGTAMDGLMSGINLGRMRGLAKTSEIHAIFCYANSGHNHLDIRLDNQHNNGGGRFVWPRRTSDGKDVASDGKVCKGGHKSPPSTGTQPPAAGLPLPDPWQHLEDPTAPTDAEGQALEEASEETWLLEDHDAPSELVDAVVDSVQEIHDDHG